MPFHLVDRLAVEEEGEGDAVVCVHGLGGDSNTWSAVAPAFANHRLVRIDLPGSGRSRAGAQALSIGSLVQAVLSACSGLGISRAHFVGHSMGTIVLQHLAATQPLAVRSLALFGPLLAPADAARANLRARAQKARTGPGGMQEIADALVQASTSADSRQRNPVVAAFVRESLMRQDPEGYAANCEALADARPAAVDRIEAPTLLVTGDEDAVAPPQSVRAMAERLRGTRSIHSAVLGRCGHWTPIERAEECARELRGFLAAQR